jgi:hypothetical protein
MRTWARKSLYGVLLFFLIIQVVRPDRTNPAIDEGRRIHASLTVEPGVASVFARSCDDCHSNQTVWPWYSGVAPVSWLVVSDVQEGRKALNFSDWKSLNPEKQQEVTQDICNEVRERKMPKAEYVFMHPRAKLTDAEGQAVCAWAHSVGQVGSEQAESDSTGDE